MLQQLSAQDASFVFMESSATPMHMGGLYIYDPSESPQGEPTEADVLNFYEQRLHLWPLMRQRLVRVPFDSDYPYWLEDEHFDLEYHIRRIALPKPADWDTLNTLTARIFSRPLDFTKPLWETYVIEGLDHLDDVPAGCFAVLTKTHHAAIDGASGMHLVEVLHDLQPEPRKIPRPASPWRPDPMPSDLELATRSGWNNVTQPFRFMQVLANQAGSMARSMRELATVKAQDLPRVVPKTRFNGRVTSHRVVGSVRFPLAEVRRMRKVVPHATVNDAVLTICGGALRGYLGAKNELDDDSLVAMAPVNVRTETDEKGVGNRVSALFVPIGTDIADPIERLRVVQGFTRISKDINNAVGARVMTDYSQFVPASTAALAGRLMANLASAPRPPFNVSITNVPGPQVPLYCMGAKLVTNMGLGPITQGMGLIMPITSYCGELIIGYTTCREIVPDSEYFSQCIKNAYTEFADAALGQETDS